MKVGPGRLRRKLQRWHVPFRLVDGWNSSSIDPYKGRSDFAGIVLHHTAGTNSEHFICFTNRYAPVRAAHFLIARTGEVVVCSGVGAYHAGEGGPWTIHKGLTIPKDSGNSRLYGIEIESLGTEARIGGGKGSMTVAQVVSTALLCAALLDAMRPGPGSFKHGRVTLHRLWAPRRKPDVKQDVDWWRAVIAIAQKHRRKPDLAEAKIRAYVKAHPSGRA